MKKTYINKIMMGLWLLVFVSLFSIMNVSASEATENTSKKKISGSYEYAYSETYQGIVITKYTGTERVVNIPAIIDGMPVKVLAPESFSGNTIVRSVTVPEGIIEMDGCFICCVNLQKVNVPEGVKSLTATFVGCAALSQIELPKSLVEIGDRAFEGCDSLEKIEMPDGVERIGDSSFLCCYNLKTIKFSKKLKYIDECGFASCEKLKRVSLPDSVVYLGSFAFNSCSSLKTVKLSKNLTSLSPGCFTHCTSLQEIVIPANIQIIKKDAFAFCSKLKKIKFQGSDMINIGEWAFHKIHPKAVFDVKKKSKKLYKYLLDGSTGYKKTMKIV